MSRRTWEDMKLGPRPLCYLGFPDNLVPSSFPSKMIFNPPAAYGTARLDYKNGWTVIVFWNGEIYFVDEILTFDGMMELIRSRFDGSHLRVPVEREYA